MFTFGITSGQITTPADVFMTAESGVGGLQGWVSSEASAAEPTFLPTSFGDITTKNINNDGIMWECIFSGEGIVVALNGDYQNYLDDKVLSIGNIGGINLFPSQIFLRDYDETIPGMTVIVYFTSEGIPIGENIIIVTPMSEYPGVTMVAGQEEIVPGVFVTGYSDGSTGDSSAIGSISGQPLLGQTMSDLSSRTGGISRLNFIGDVVSLLTGKSLFVDGVGYAFADVSPYSDFVYTYVEWSGGTGPTFTNGVSYNIRIE